VFGRAPDWRIVSVSTTITVVLFAAAFVMFKRMDKYFADVI
jgi:ABC-type polysaccharide/polyol phosphate export permease